jgi:putative ABC transport system ATP-binding protein
MISLRGISRVYPLKGGPFYAVRDINLEIKEGDFLSIMGPSGSGKSTLLHILGIHDSAWSGEYDLVGQSVHRLDKKKRFELQKKQIGFVFQSYHLLDDLTVYENLEIPLSYRDTPKKDRDAIVCDTLDRFHMVGKKDLYPSQLSGGQQQLVGIARALIAKPALILADEPTGNLHSDQGREIMQLFKKLNQQDGVTIVQVTHSEENASFGTRIVRLADGLMLKPDASR